MPKILITGNGFDLNIGFPGGVQKAAHTLFDLEVVIR